MDSVGRTLALAMLAVGSLATPVYAQIVGLLSLPNVLGTGPCDRFTPEDIVLYAAADSSQAIGFIRVDRYWTFHEDGGCEGLRINVHRHDGSAPRDLPTREYGYESSGAIVLERRNQWFRIRLPDGSAWLRAPAQHDFFPLEQLFADGLTYLTEAWDGRVAARPQGDTSPVTPAGSGFAHVVRVLGLRKIAERLWVELELLSHSPCASNEEPRVVARGWVPAHTDAGENTVWFYSRGC